MPNTATKPLARTDVLVRKKDRSYFIVLDRNTEAKLGVLFWRNSSWNFSTSPGSPARSGFETKAEALQALLDIGFGRPE